MAYLAPRFKLPAFNCPYCGAYAHVNWHQLRLPVGNVVPTACYLSSCSHCRKSTYWLSDLSQTDVGILIHPSAKFAPMAHPEMPPEIQVDYNEARDIAEGSPRGAAALLRLCVQKICKHLGEPGKNINEDIGALVKKGLPTEIQQALDFVRVIGNNAVHPGKLSTEDVAEVVEPMFEIVNHIIEDRIARPKKLASLFSSLPKPVLDEIAKRDSTPQ